MPDEARQAQGDQALIQVRMGVPADVTPVQIEADITASRADKLAWLSPGHGFW
jgi:hypothetical protein